MRRNARFLLRLLGPYFRAISWFSLPPSRRRAFLSSRVKYYRVPFWHVQRVSRTPLYCNGARKNLYTAPALVRLGTRHRRVRLDRHPKVATRRWQTTKTHRHFRFQMLRCLRRGNLNPNTIGMLCRAEGAGWLASPIHRSVRRLLESLRPRHRCGRLETEAAKIIQA